MVPFPPVFFSKVFILKEVRKRFSYAFVSVDSAGFSLTVQSMNSLTISLPIAAIFPSEISNGLIGHHRIAGSINDSNILQGNHRRTKPDEIAGCGLCTNILYDEPILASEPYWQKRQQFDPIEAPLPAFLMCLPRGLAGKTGLRQNHNFAFARRDKLEGHQRIPGSLNP